MFLEQSVFVLTLGCAFFGRLFNWDVLHYSRSAGICKNALSSVFDGLLKSSVGMSALAMEY